MLSYQQALISACEKGGRLDKALQVYEEMKAAGREADMITFSNLLTGKRPQARMLP
jgi:pentatricopeptide repeat protein